MKIDAMTISTNLMALPKQTNVIYREEIVASGRSEDEQGGLMRVERKDHQVGKKTPPGDQAWFWLRG